MSHKWDSDRPGKVPEDDALNRVAFAQRLAKELGAWRHKDSLVVSLNGDWGSGKSTLKNLILYYLDEQCRASKKKPPVVVEFNPWQWSGQDKLMDGFFSEIGTAFRSDAICDRAAAKKLARFWEGLRVVSSAGAELADRLQSTVTAIAALLAGGAGVASGYIDSPTGKASLAYGSLFLMTVAGILGIYAPIAEKLGLVVEWQLKKKQRSLEAIKDDLRNELKELEQPLIVVIDDIDRLTKREVRLLVQLIKANADFPNLVYLLLYQKSIVADALGEITCEEGQEFLKKIVQVELEVPAAPDHKMRNLFGKGLERILSTAEIRWDKERWRRLFENAVWPYFRTPREIKRFLGVFEFYFEGHVIEGTLEVNPIDLVLLETLRVFDPTAYEAVGRAFQKQRNIFIEILFDDKEARERFALGMKELIEREGLAKTEQTRLRALLLGLFPQAENHSSERDHEWKRDLRICHATHFPRYFQLGSEPGDVSASLVAKLMRSTTDLPESGLLLQESLSAGNFLALLERLHAVSEDVSPSQAERIITALFEISDNLPELKGGLVSASNAEREIARLSGHLLSSLTDKSARESVLAGAVLATTAVTGPVLTAAWIEPEQDRHGTHKEALIEPSTLKKIQSSIVPRMWEAAISGTIWRLRFGAAVLYRLRDWTSLEAVREWLSSALKVPANAIAFLTAVLQETQVSGSGGTRTVFYLRPERIHEFTDLESLIVIAEQAATTPLQKAAIAACKMALERRQSTEPNNEIEVMTVLSDGTEVLPRR